MKRYVIVGGGAAGLTLAYYLCKAGLPVTVLEREAKIGGLSRSFHYGDWTFDIGPHRFYSQNPKVNNFLREIHHDQFEEIQRFSQVYFMGCYHDWPLRLATIAKLPLHIAIQAGLDMLIKTERSLKTSQSFKDYVLCRYGKTLYQTFFKDYTEKFVGISTEQTHKNWAKIGLERATIDDKVSTASLFDIFKLMLLPKKAELNFLYPKQGGICSFWESCQDKIKALGGEIVTNCDVTELVCTQQENGRKRIDAVVTPQHGVIACEQIAWSASINELTAKLAFTPTNLNYRSQLICNVMLDKEPLQRSQWCYFGDKNLLFSRVSNPACFNPSCVPSGKGGLCLEITCQYQDALWQDPNKQILRLLKELKQVKAIEENSQILDVKLEKIRDAYPIYSLDYIDRLNLLERECSEFDNLELLGRTGRFWYNNLDHSIENSLSTAAKYLLRLDVFNDRRESVLKEVN